MKVSILVFHEIPKVLAMPVPESVMNTISSDTLTFGGIEPSTRASVKFHLGGGSIL